MPRIDIVELLPSNAICVELGVAKGEFSFKLLNESSIRMLYSIDRYAGDRRHDDEQYLTALKRLREFRHRNTIIRMSFDKAVGWFENEHFDLVYVDGYAHTGQENGNTISDWYPKVKRGGIIGGDDYDPKWPLTVKAVDAFVLGKGLELNVIEGGDETPEHKYNNRFPI